MELPTHWIVIRGDRAGEGAGPTATSDSANGVARCRQVGGIVEERITKLPVTVREECKLGRQGASLQSKLTA